MIIGAPSLIVTKGPEKLMLRHFKSSCPTPSLLICIQGKQVYFSLHSITYVWTFFTGCSSAFSMIILDVLIMKLFCIQMLNSLTNCPKSIRPGCLSSSVTFRMGSAERAHYLALSAHGCTSTHTSGPIKLMLLPKLDLNPTFFFNTVKTYC